GQRGSRALVLAIEGPCPGLSPAPSLGAALALASPRVIASNRDAYDHDGTGNLVLRLISVDGLVTDGTWSSRAKTPEGVSIAQWPQRGRQAAARGHVQTNPSALVLPRSLIAGRRL